MIDPIMEQIKYELKRDRTYKKRIKQDHEYSLKSYWKKKGVAVSMDDSFQHLINKAKKRK